MTAAMDSLVLGLLEWIGPAGRTYQETMDAWKTSCPQLAVWEEADVRGLTSRLGLSRVGLTDAGLDLLRLSA
jgi:D-3-phosphoglycerate dehydrogenase